jgi:hypothetical protein
MRGEENIGGVDFTCSPSVISGYCGVLISKPDQASKLFE